jgi:uncharacterized protein YecT (DUF1311 family)
MEELIAAQVAEVESLAGQLGRPALWNESQIDWERFRLRQCGSLSAADRAIHEAQLEKLRCHAELLDRRFEALEEEIVRAEIEIRASE